MADLSKKKHTHMSAVVTAINQILAGANALRNAAMDANLEGYLNPTTGLQDADFAANPDTAHVSAAAYRASMAAVSQLDQQLNSGTPSIYSLLYPMKP